jgi:hypothetical protein
LIEYQVAVLSDDSAKQKMIIIPRRKIFAESLILDIIVHSPPCCFVHLKTGTLSFCSNDVNIDISILNLEEIEC